VRLVQRELEVAVVRDPACISDGIGELNKGGRNLFCRFHIQLIRIELHTIRVADRFAGLQAEHQLVRAEIFFLEVVAIVGAGQRDVHFLGDLEQSAIRNSLMVQSVRLHLKVEVFLPEDFLKLPSHSHGAIHVLLANEVRDLAAQAARQGNQSLMVLF
jgi:hypothetical protein